MKVLYTILGLATAAYCLQNDAWLTARAYDIESSLRVRSGNAGSHGGLKKRGRGPGRGIPQMKRPKPNRDKSPSPKSPTEGLGTHTFPPPDTSAFKVQAKAEPPSPKSPGILTDRKNMPFRKPWGSSQNLYGDGQIPSAEHIKHPDPPQQ